MSKPLPTADAALLEAQATAGMAGVAAYQAAQTEMETQRAAALSQARAEAAARGAPTDALAAIQSTITAPYDRRIASLTEGGATAQADAERRAGRLNDYNAAVEAARALIPEQTAQAVAPINAESSFRLRMADMEGQRTLDQIDAQIRLETARAQAAAAAAARRAASSGGGGAKKQSVTATELRDMLIDPNIGNAAGKVQQAAGVVHDATSGARQEAYTDRNAIEAAMRMAQAELDWRTSHPPTSTSASDRSIASLTERRIGYPSDRQRAAMQTEPRAPEPRRIPHPNVATNSVVSAETGERIQLWGPDSLPEPRTGPQFTVTPIGRRLSGLNRGDPTASEDRRREAARDQAAERDRIDDIAADIRSRYPGLPARPPAAEMPLLADLYDDYMPSGPLTQGAAPPTIAQHLGDNPLSSIIGLLGDDVRAGGDVDRALLGSAGEPYQEQSAVEAMRQAMILSALDLVEQGYDIDQPTLAAALDAGASYNYGDTALDVYAKGVGQPDAGTQYEDAVAAYEAEQASTAEWESGKLDRIAQESDDRATELEDEAARQAAAAQQAWYEGTSSQVPTGQDPNVLMDALNTNRGQSVLLALDDALQAGEFDPSLSGDAGDPWAFLALEGFDPPLNPANLADKAIIEAIKAIYGG